MMGMQKSKANSNTLRTGGGFSAIELLVTALILAVVTGLGLIGVTRARASVRLSSAAREYASYIEKARLFSIRSHADNDAERASITINEDKASYNVTLDLDGDGDLDTTTVTLPSGVTFDTVETIAFDWRGRTMSTVGGITSPNAQVSITINNGSDTISIDVTGSGDITVDSHVFDDSVPNVVVNVDDLATGATPVPTPSIVSTPTPTEEPVPVGTPDTTVNPSPTPSPGDGGTDVIDVPTPTPTPVATATPTPTPTATPTPRAVPTPTPIPAVCSISADMLTLSLAKDGTASVKVSHDANTTLTITGSSSKASDVQVTPASQTVAPGSFATFTIKSKKSLGIYSVTFGTSCGSKTVSVVVLL